jgi:CHAT domain-containing protein
MLKAPIYRRYDRPGMGYPLFKDGASRDGTINCLIVAADPRGCDLGDPWNTPLEELSKLLDEVKTVEAILQREKTERGGIGEVRLFEAGKHPDPAGELTKLLQKGPWHLVHFAGHAVRSGAAGALVLGGERGAVLPIGNLAEQLAEAGTQFLYLSSCRSADAYFVMRLVEQRLPAVLGFRWPVNDPKAMEYARRFYEALFEKESSRKYLEYAFLSAKRELHRMCEAEQKPDSTWAAPVLVMQVNQKGLPAVPGRQGSVEDGPRATLH